MALMEGVFNMVPRTGHPAELNKKSLCATLMRLFPNGGTPITGLSAMMGTTTAVRLLTVILVRLLSLLLPRFLLTIWLLLRLLRLLRLVVLVWMILSITLPLVKICELLQLLVMC
jgi:hypothetical protein